MKVFKFALPAFILVGFTFSSSVLTATPAMGKKEGGAKCVVCHTKGKELNKVGECYKAKKDLAACEAAK